MKKFLSITAISAILATSLIAETFNLDMGWTLLGSSDAIDVSKEFNNSNVRIIWKYERGAWLAYSPNSIIQSQLETIGYSTFTLTDASKGFWVYSDNPITITTSSTSSSSSYSPETTYIGDLWGHKWNKILSFYPGDTRFEGNDVEKGEDGEYVVLKAYKKDNNVSISQITTDFIAPIITHIDTDVNLVTDNIYSLFQLRALSKDISTSEVIGDLENNNNLEFIVGINISAHIIKSWYSIYNPANNKTFKEIINSEYFGTNLTTLTDKSDVTLNIDAKDGKIFYSVINLDDNSTLYNNSFDINSTKVTNFTGFKYIATRSLIDDAAANANSDEAIDISENVVNNFNVDILDITDEADIVKLFPFTPIDINASDFENKLLISHKTIDDNETTEFIFLGNKDAKPNVTYYEYNSKTGELIDSNNSTYELYEDYNFFIVLNSAEELDIIGAVKEKKGNIYTIYEYDLNELHETQKEDTKILLDSNQTTDVDEYVVKNYFTSSDLQPIPDINGSWQLNDDLNNTITFDIENNTFNVSDGTYGEIFIDSDILIMTPSSEEKGKAYIVVTNSGSDFIDGYNVFTDKENNLTDVKILHLTK